MPKKQSPPTNRDLLLLQAARLSALYESNLRSTGFFKPPEKMWTEERAVTQADWEAHIMGTQGVGLVPIQDDDTCVWAALDLDNHDSDEDLPIDEVAEKIAIAKLPLIAVRSKSGGIHCYLFLEKPQPCAKVRIWMTSWAVTLGYAGCEVFPKQGKLVYDQTKNERAKGNWINLPYFGGESTVRYARRDGHRLSLDQFLDLAEKSRVSESDIRALTKAEHPEAPPCIQKLYQQGVAQGYRNEGLYNLVIYLKKADPENFTAKAVEANSSVFSKPLPRGELTRTINSAARADCTYRCSEEPIRSLCERQVCVTRKFGISSMDLERLDTVDALPKFADLTKYVTEPVRWEISIDGRKISNITTDDLLDWRAIRKMVADRLTRVVPMIKNQEWERILHPLMATARIIEAPDDASISGAMRDRLREFCAKADLMSKGQDPSERKVLLRGLPVVQDLDGERVIVFRGKDFQDFLKRTKGDELKGVNLWMAIKDMGTQTTKIRIGDQTINVWTLPLKQALRDDADPLSFKSEM